MTVRVRFAPSPTGFVHIGSLRTALYNYLFAEQEKGEYILRIEDTDQTRFVDGAIENMLDALEWAGVKHTEGVMIKDGELKQVGDYGPYVQSERLHIYKEYIEKLLSSGKAYYCFCSKERMEKVREEQMKNGQTPKYDGACRNLTLEEARKRVAAGEPHVVRLRLPEHHDIKFEDVVRGEVVVNTDDLDDQVLIKSDGFPTYHFAVVIDDYLMKITHVIRGEEWVISTPKHVYLYEALGWEAPKFVHLPNILNSERKKLSKRQGDVAAADFKNKGYLPEGLINYLALVGWSPEDEKELFTMEELVAAFSLERVSKSGGIFDTNKLNWVNNHYIKESTAERLADLAIPFLVEAGHIEANEIENRYNWIKDLMEVLKERLNCVQDVLKEAEIFFSNEVVLENEEAEDIIKMEHVKELMLAFKQKIEEAEAINPDTVKQMFKQTQKETGYKGKNLYMPVRVAITGEVHGPDMGLTLKLLGKENILSRIDYTIENHIK